MTEKNYNVSGAERKALVNKIAELTGQNPVYLGMPSTAFRVGAFEISRTGKLTWDEGTDDSSVEDLIEKLREAGFTAAEDQEAAAPSEQESADETETAGDTQEAETAAEEAEDTDTLSISLPDDLTEEQFTLLQRLVSGKETLIKHAFKTDSVEIERAEGKLTFPWFTATDGDHTMAYTLFLTHLVKFAKKASRVTVHDQPVENEKFSFRIFLIRLGMVGTEFKGARKILLENLTGNSAWRDGKPKNSEIAAAAAEVNQCSVDNSNSEEDATDDTETDGSVEENNEEAGA